MLPPEIEQIFDEPTRKLFDEVKQDFSISFEPWDKNFWEVETRENYSIIFYDVNDINTSSLAHELLHLKLKQFDYLTMNHFYMSYLGDEFWGDVWNKFLCDHVKNCMAHTKIYPEYIKMGYSANSFVINADKPQATVSGIKHIYLKRNGILSAYDTNLYIGNLIAMYGDNYGHDYTKEFSLLRKKDDELFDIVTRFWNSWVNFELSHENNDTQFIYDDFMNELESWYFNKINFKSTL